MKNKIENLVKHRNLILEELSAVTREIEDAQTDIYRHIASEKIIVQRYFDGESIVKSFDRYWWISQDGDLVGLVDESDISDLKALEERGIFERVTINS